MDPETVDWLEQEIERAIVERLSKRGARRLPLAPEGRTIHLMAKAAVSVYEAAVENHSESA